MSFTSLLTNALLYGPVALLALAGGFVFGFVYRRVLRQFFPKTVRGQQHNIISNGRLVRAIAGGGLLIVAVLTDWSPSLFFWSGFCFFEAIFSRCGFFAAIGKTECPLK